MESQPPLEEFRIEAGGDTQTVTGREQAVRVAKHLSDQRRGRVRVEREDGAVRMQFRDGLLETLVTETRDRRRR